MKLTTEKIGDHRIDIEVDGNGGFFADFNDQSYSAKTLEELKATLTKAVKRATQQAAVPVTVLGIIETTARSSYSSDGPFREGAGFVHAKLRAKHERQYNTYLLVTDDDRMSTQKFQIYGSSNGTICRRLTLAEVTRYMELAEAKRLAVVALEDFIGEAKVKPETVLEAARKS